MIEAFTFYFIEKINKFKKLKTKGKVVCRNCCIMDYVAAKRKWQESKDPPDHVHIAYDPWTHVALFSLPQNLYAAKSFLNLNNNNNDNNHLRTLILPSN